MSANRSQVLVALGISHNSAPVELREAVNVSERELPSALEKLAAVQGIQEAVLLSTCNRTELYCAVEASHANDDIDAQLTSYLVALHGIPISSLAGHLYCYHDGAAAAHLMNVTSGLDSLVLGEYQILAQVKTAYAAAKAASTTGALLNTLFQNALATAKRVRTETEIGRGSFSIGSAAVELARQIFGETLEGRNVLILGAGKMSDLTARHLQAQGAATIFVANRTYQRAVELAGHLGSVASARHFEDLPALLTSSDIVICSTAAPHPVVTRSLLEASLKARRNRPLFLIDIAVPRDVEPSAAELDNVYLFNIDDLKQVVEKSRAERAKEVDKAKIIIDRAIDDFLIWWRSLEVAPLIVAVRRRIQALGAEEAAKLRAKLPNIGDREAGAVTAAMEALSNRIAHSATMAIKECAGISSEEAAQRLDAIRTAFGVEPDEIDQEGGK
ncbi:MAG: glutamyl-tRNA reductase [Capsulimonadaceae bacterium]|nr:glutamyl-tRNA reductase [Capsulimonadaceae bacterium]